MVFICKHMQYLDCLLIAFISACTYSVCMEIVSAKVLAILSSIQNQNDRTTRRTKKESREPSSNQSADNGEKVLFTWPTVDFWHLLPKVALDVKEWIWNQGEKYLEKKST